MQYVFLAGACVCFSLQFIFTKLFQKRAGGTLKAGIWNSLLSGTAAFVIFFIMNGFSISFSASSVIFGLVYSVSGIVCTAASVIGLSCAGVGLMTFYTLLGGMVLPFAYGVVILEERPSPLRWAGAALLIIAPAIPLLFSRGTNITQRDRQETNASVKQGRLKLMICAAAVFLSNGFVSVATTAAMRAKDAVSEKDFLLAATLLKIAISLAMLAFLGLRQRSFLPFDQKTGRAAAPAVFLLLAAISCGYAVLNGAGSVFNLICARTIDASLQYPVISAACIILSSLFGLLFFKEKPGRGDILGIAVSIAGIVLSAF